MQAKGTPFGCLNPQTVVNPYTGEKLVVPCGKCAACALRKASRYTTQIQLEAQSSYIVLFVTLTYANTYVPTFQCVPFSNELPRVNTLYNVYDDQTGEYLGTCEMLPENLEALRKKVHLFGKIPYLRKEDIQKFMKRLRKNLSNYDSEKIRYFVCGEYGPVHFRPHFHLLLFLQSGKFLEPSGHKLKEFPEWTWKNSEGADPESELSLVEYAVRSCWKYGSVDAVFPKGDCASYVASYVNGFGNLPKVLRMPEAKPFTCHSRFLGFKLCKEKREEILSASPEQIVHRGIQIGKFYKEFDLWRSCTDVFFPRCKGYAAKSARERLFSYRLYLAARKDYPETPLMTVALELACFCMKYFNRGLEYDDLPPGFPAMTAILVKYFKKSANIPNRPYSEYEYKEISTFVNSIYRELCISRHFLTFVCNGDYKQKASELYYRKIEDFYNYLERMKLARWYEEQQAYFMKDYAVDEDIVFFYDNVGVTDDEIRSSLAYQKFEVSVTERIRNMQKHKYLNDLNAVFNNV